MNPTSDPFSVFDYPGQIVHVPFSDGVTNQLTGMWTAPEAPVTATLTGDLQDLTYQDLQKMPEGEYAIGDRRIFTAAALCTGDVLQVTEADGSVSEWTVKALEKTTHIMPKFGLPSRNVYLLKRRG
jgi:hypothetical protein